MWPNPWIFPLMDSWCDSIGRQWKLPHLGTARRSPRICPWVLYLVPGTCINTFLMAVRKHIGKATEGSVDFGSQFDCKIHHGREAVGHFAYPRWLYVLSSWQSIWSVRASLCLSPTKWAAYKSLSWRASPVIAIAVTICTFSIHPSLHPLTLRLSHSVGN